MFHTITFVADITVHVEVAPGNHVEQRRLREGTRRCVHLRPYVAAVDGALIPVADLLFADNSYARGVPFESFRVADCAKPAR